MGHPLKHFITITRHRHKVMSFCFKVGIGWQGLKHDLSKYSPSEFISSAHYYVGTHSPIDEERKAKGYSAAWLHHKGRNRHHFEYWTVYSRKEGKYIPIKMPIKYLKEMLCDRVAATMIYHGKNYQDNQPLDYLLASNEGVEAIHPETLALLTGWLELVAKLGHKAAFKEIKKIKVY